MLIKGHHNDYWKILNNNVIITTDENHKEIVVMGRGLAYKNVQESIYQRIKLIRYSNFQTQIYLINLKN